ncbi:MAG: glycosyltransferase [Bacteroidales bacterium]|nr:glycosyltransferase [Bacteroidales bacterium]
MKLSIITINYNNLSGLQKTIDSVIAQTFKDYEWIVIDGGSTDGSKELLEKNQSHFAYWCSEPDKGVYNAMNKGLSQAHGEYVQFLNSGDWLYEKKTIEKIFSQINNQYEIFYGDTILAYSDGWQNPIVYPDELGFYYFPYNSLCHQAIFYRRSLFDNNYFDESYTIVSDWAMNLKLLFKGATFKHINQFIVYYDMGGISSIADPKHHNERMDAFSKYVPQQIQIDVKKYEYNYHFSRHRKSTRWIIDNAISFSKWLDKKLSKIESKRSK